MGLKLKKIKIITLFLLVILPTPLIAQSSNTIFYKTSATNKACQFTLDWMKENSPNFNTKNQDKFIGYKNRSNFIVTNNEEVNRYEDNALDALLNHGQLTPENLNYTPLQDGKPNSVSSINNELNKINGLLVKKINEYLTEVKPLIEKIELDRKTGKIPHSSTKAENQYYKLQSLLSSLRGNTNSCVTAFSEDQWNEAQQCYSAGLKKSKRANGLVGVKLLFVLAFSNPDKLIMNGSSGKFETPPTESEIEEECFEKLGATLLAQNNTDNLAEKSADELDQSTQTQDVPSEEQNSINSLNVKQLN